MLAIAGVCVGAAQQNQPSGAVTDPSASAQRPDETQMPRFTGGIVGPWYDRLRNPYSARTISRVDFRNSGRFGSLLRGGNLYLSLSDAIALALENNLDIQLQRYTIPTANSEVLRANGGGTTRGLLYEIRELPAGQGGPGTPFLTTVGGTTPISSVPANAVDLAPIQGTTNSLTIPGTIPFSGGTPIPRFDPALVGTGSYLHENLPQTNPLVAGANNLIDSNIGGNLGYQQGFSPGTNLNVNLLTNRISSNSSRTLYNPYVAGNLAVTVTQPLLQGFGIGVNRRYIRIAKNEQKISDGLFRQQLIDTLAAVERLYWDLVSLNEDVRVKQQAVALAQKLYEDNQTQVEVGTLAPIEVKRAQAQLALSRQDLINSSGLVAQQELVLKNVLTRRGNYDPLVASAHIIPSDVIQIPAQEPARDSQSLVQLAYQNRPDLEQAALQLQNANITLEGSKNNLLPQVNIVGNYQSNALAGDLNSLYNSVGTTTGADPNFIGGAGTYLRANFQPSQSDV